MIDPWAAGQYFPLRYLKGDEAVGEVVKFSQTFKPESK
jgi:hypothetical protein